MNRTASRTSSVTSGVQQGCVLGPLLFVIYINNIDLGLLNNVLKHADDAKLEANELFPKGVRGGQLEADLPKLWEW